MTTQDAPQFLWASDDGEVLNSIVTEVPDGGGPLTITLARNTQRDYTIAADWSVMLPRPGAGSGSSRILATNTVSRSAPSDTNRLVIDFTSRTPTSWTNNGDAPKILEAVMTHPRRSPRIAP